MTCFLDIDLESSLSYWVNHSQVKKEKKSIIVFGFLNGLSIRSESCQHRNGGYIKIYIKSDQFLVKVIRPLSL